jgi:hypothetical protein
MTYTDFESNKIRLEAKEMSDLSRLLAVSLVETTQFFYNHLCHNIPSGLAPEETRYVANILASNALTSRFGENSMGSEVSLGGVLEDFVIPALSETFTGAPDP